jgi:integrase
VALLSPAGPHWHRLQYIDPDTGQRKRKAVPRNLTTKKAREQFRADFEKELSNRRIDLERGATPKKGAALADAVERYYPQAKLADETTYRLATSNLVEWYERAGVTSCDDIDAESLWRWREHVVTRKKKNGRPYAFATVNTDLRKVKTALFYLSDAKLLPAITEREIKKACAPLKTTGKKKSRGAAAKPRPKQYLTPAELSDLFAALERHDADTYGETDRKGTPGRVRRMEPLAPFFAVAVLTGLRREELLGLTWDRVHLDGDGYLEIDEEIAKLHTDRRVALGVSPMAKRILRARKLQGGRGLVWPFTDDEINQALKRIRRQYDAPAHFTLKALRRTTATYLTSAPGIYGGATVFHSAEQMGHSIETARGFYLHRVHGIDPDAKTIEAALEITDEVEHILDMMQVRQPKKRTA